MRPLYTYLIADASGILTKHPDNATKEYGNGEQFD